MATSQVSPENTELQAVYPSVCDAEGDRRDEQVLIASGCLSGGSNACFEQREPPAPFKKGAESARQGAGSPLFISFETNCTRSGISTLEVVSDGLGADSTCDYCGQHTLSAESKDGSRKRFWRLHCRTWRCLRCGKKRAALYRFRIGEAAAEHRLQRFLTLTLDPKKIEGDRVKYLRTCFARLRARWIRKYGVAPSYICILEFQRNGNPHLHLLVDRFMLWKKILAEWKAVGGGGVWITRVKLCTQKQVANYLVKYLTKDSTAGAELRTRRVVASEGIKLIGKVKDSVWQGWRRVSKPIENFFFYFEGSRFLLDAGRDVSTGELEWFEVSDWGWEELTDYW